MLLVKKATEPVVIIFYVYYVMLCYVNANGDPRARGPSGHDSVQGGQAATHHMQYSPTEMRGGIEPTILLCLKVL